MRDYRNSRRGIRRARECRREYVNFSITGGNENDEFVINDVEIIMSATDKIAECSRMWIMICDEFGMNRV